MRRPRVAVSVALIAMLALVVTPGIVGSRNPSRTADIAPDAFHEVVEDLGPGPTMAPDTTDPQDDSRAALAADDVIADPPAASTAPWQRLELAQPSPELAAVLKPTPAPTRAPIVGTSATGTGWHWDSNVSFYGPGFYGGRTACGQTYTTTIMGVAHRTLPCGTRVTFRNPKNGRTFTVPVIDRGPYVDGRQWDLSGGLCVALDHCYTGPIEWRFP